MSIRSRIQESPAMRKLVGNRGAMIASGIISLYLLLFVWILAMQFVAWIGNTTDSFDLRQSPVMGALLPERTLERVGASNELGFGLHAEQSKRMEQIGFYFDHISKMFDELEQESTNAVEARSEAEIRNSVSLAERKIAGLPIDQLKERYDAAQTIFERQGKMRSLRDTLPQIGIAIEKLTAFRSDYEAAEPDTEDWEIAGEEVALTLDEILVLIENYSINAPDGDPIATLDTSSLQDAMDAAFDLAPLDPIYDASVIDRLSAGVASAGPGCGS